MKISPENVKTIKEWVKDNFPKAEVKVTGYDALTGADGIYFETPDLDEFHAMELLEIRRNLNLPIGLWNTSKLSEVSFNILYPRPKTFKA